MPSKVSKTKIKMRMTRTSSAKMESGSQPPAKTIKTSIECHHHIQQRQKSQEDCSISSDSNSKISNAPSTKSNTSTKDQVTTTTTKPTQVKHRVQKIPSKEKAKGHPDDKSSHTSSSSDEKHCELDGPIYKRYTIKTRLGKGAYGIVWEAYEKATGNKVALKKIFDAFRNDTDAQRTYREIMFLREFGSHPNIIRLLNVHRAVNNMDIHLVFPFMDHDLHRLIKESPQLLKDCSIRMIFYQTLKAVKYLHSGDVIHRDLKPANILLDDSLNVKVADFGLARSLSNSEDIMSETNAIMTDYVATRWYRPPEILLSCPYYTKGVDMWSLGCILGEMILKVPLFPGGSTVHQVETIMSHILPPTAREIEEMCGQHVQSTMIETAMTYRKKSLSEIFERCDADTQDLIERFLVFSPGKRINAEETLGHPYLARYRRPAEEIVMSHPVSPPLNDYIQLPMCQYRSVIYDLIQVRKVRQQQPPPQPYQHLQPQRSAQSMASSVSTPISKSRCYSQPGVITHNAPGVLYSSQNNVNEPELRSTNAAGGTAGGATNNGNFSKHNARRESERETRKSNYPVKAAPTASRERVLTASSVEQSGRMVKVDNSKSIIIGPEGDGNDSQKVKNLAGPGSNCNYSNPARSSGRERGARTSKKNNSTPNIPQARKIPGPDGDGHALPLPYIKLVSTAPGLQGSKNPRLFDRSDLSARTSKPIPCDLRGADKRLFEIFSNTEDLEEEIKAIEFKVRAKRVNNSAQAQWITELSNNLNKASVSDPPNSFSNLTHNAGVRESKTNNSQHGTKVKSHHQTKLPEILQSWNYGQGKAFNSTIEPTVKLGRRSTYFQDPPAALVNSCSTKSSSSVAGQQNVSGSRLTQYSPTKDHTQLRQTQTSNPSNPHAQFHRSTTPVEVIQARNKHFETYSQTHGTISASDLSELKVNLGFLGKSS